MKRLIVCALASVLVLAACGNGEKKDGNSGGSSAQTPAASGSQTVKQCGKGTGESMAKYKNPPPTTIDQNKQYFATIKMDIGDVKLELFPKEAPCHVNSFVFLARDKFYDGTTFHRVIKGFVAQGGDPTGTGSGGPGYTVPLEVNSHKHVDGALGMARTNDPNSAGSQFFIDLAPQPSLDSGYTVFGQVVEGRDVVDKIAARDPQTARTPGTKINTIVIEEK